MNTFEIKTKVVFGDNALSALSELSYENAVVFTDAFMAKSGNGVRLDLLSVYSAWAPSLKLSALACFQFYCYVFHFWLFSGLLSLKNPRRRLLHRKSWKPCGRFSSARLYTVFF